ncbi:MAG: YdbL family protein [Asticcacaulis sp.]|uniref:YdbL family protein n=1 Tax=Asticcacaulis sp. TaxID=1872648 RepID=UPI0039E649C6
MKKTSLLKAAAAALALATSAVAVSAVMTQPAVADVAGSKALVDAAKAKGTVGERNNGYLGFVSGAGDAATKAAVDEINAGRSSVYGQAAAKNGVSPEAAGISAFANVIQPKLKAGEYYQDASGNWVKK